MPCTTCNESVITVQGIQTFSQGCCDPCSSCKSGAVVDSTCVLYTGPALPCTAIATNSNLEDILVAFDQALCAAVGDYSTYNVGCLAPITTQQEFVEAISDFVCQTRTDLDTFTGTTFPNYQDAVDSRFVAIEVPGITCATASVINTDTLQTVLNKYCTKFGAINSLLDVSGADWNACYVVSPLPSTPREGFDTLISQICQLKNSGGSGTLPIFNNVGSCLPAPLTTTDTLVSTVNKIKTRLCQTPTFDINALTWTCITKPSSTTTDLQDAFQSVLTKLATLIQNFPTFSGDFTVDNVDPMDPCQGKTISLSSSPYVDKYVAATSADPSPGTLQDKLLAGTNITLDYVTTPGKAIISSSAGATADEKVKSYNADPSAGYLINKVNGVLGSFGITITTNLNVTTNQVDLSASLDPLTFITAMAAAASDSPEILAAWCSINAQCPSPCSTPTNVEVTYISGTTTTSTTTTTTTTP